MSGALLLLFPRTVPRLVMPTGTPLYAHLQFVNSKPKHSMCSNTSGSKVTLTLI
jgi:hypothetical protein